MVRSSHRNQYLGPLSRLPSSLPPSIHTGWGWGIWLAGSSLVLHSCKRAGRGGGHVTALRVARKTLLSPRSMFPRHCIPNSFCPYPFGVSGPLLPYYPGSSLLLQSSSIRSSFSPYNRPFLHFLSVWGGGGGWNLNPLGRVWGKDNRVYKNKNAQK